MQCHVSFGAKLLDNFIDADTVLGREMGLRRGEKQEISMQMISVMLTSILVHI